MEWAHAILRLFADFSGVVIVQVTGSDMCDGEDQRGSPEKDVCTDPCCSRWLPVSASGSRYEFTLIGRRIVVCRLGGTIKFRRAASLFRWAFAH